MGFSIALHVMPFFLVRVALGLAPWLARYKVKRLGIGRPREGMHRLLTARHRRRFTTICGNDVELRDGLLLLTVSGLVERHRTAGEKGDPAAIGRPLSIAVLS